MNRTTTALLVPAASDSNTDEGNATTRKTIDYARLGFAACEAFAGGPATFADFLRTTLSIAAKVHQPESLDPFTAMSQTRH